MTTVAHAPADPTLNTAPHEWTYQAQGAANIVFKYDGIPPQPEFVGKVLRVRKENAHRSAAEVGAEEEDELEVGFGGEVVAPLLGDEFVLPIRSFMVEQDWLEDLRELLGRNPATAADRAAGAEIDVQAGRVQLTDNLTHGQDSLAIEIKPKWGFLPPPPPTQSSLTPTACRFCKHSTLRRAQLSPADKHAAHQAGYCPLDLYSGSEVRVSQAVHALVAAWRATRGKQNNLRVFWNGSKVIPDDAATLAEIEHALKPAHIPNLPDLAADTGTQCLEAHIRTAIVASPLFARLRHLQSTFAPITVTQLLPRLPDALPPQPTLAAWREFISKHLPTPLTADAPVENLLLGHSLSATFKDCSVFLRLTRDPGTGEWRTDVKAIDLDPKPLGKLHKWAELEREVDEGWERESRAWREAGWEVRECYE